MHHRQYVPRQSKEYLDKHRLEHIVKTYSNHVAFPISFVDDLGDNHRLNDGKALWARQKSDITQADYNEFYQDVESEFEYINNCILDFRDKYKNELNLISRNLPLQISSKVR